MTTLAFDRAAGFMSVSSDDGVMMNRWPAANNVDSHSLGHWPVGKFSFSYWEHHDGDNAEGAYGTYGICIFSVPGRTGMGVHSGRQTEPDGLGRVGVEHCTFGCIRTTDAAMQALEAIHADDPITTITVT